MVSTQTLADDIGRHLHLVDQAREEARTLRERGRSDARAAAELAERPSAKRLVNVRGAHVAVAGGAVYDLWSTSESRAVRGCSPRIFDSKGQFS